MPGCRRRLQSGKAIDSSCAKPLREEISDQQLPLASALREVICDQRLPRQPGRHSDDPLDLGDHEHQHVVRVLQDDDRRSFFNWDSGPGAVEELRRRETLGYQYSMICRVPHRNKNNKRNRSPTPTL